MQAQQGNGDAGDNVSDHHDLKNQILQAQGATTKDKNHSSFNTFNSKSYQFSFFKNIVLFYC